MPTLLESYLGQNAQTDQGNMQRAETVQGILGRQAQMKEMQRKAQEQQRIRGVLSSLPKGALTPEVVQGLASQGVDVSPFVNLMKLQQPRVVNPGDTLVGPDNKPVFTAPPKPETPQESPLAKLIRENNALPEGHPSKAFYKDAIQRATTHQPATAVTVDTRQESEFNKKVGAELGEQYAGLMRADMNAPTTLGKYQRLGSLLSEVGTGKFKGSTVDLKAALKGVGMDLGALGIRDDVAPAQAARALANQLALELRNPSGGAGMPGAMSDQDRAFLLQMVPSLETDPAAWPKMIEYRTKLAQREQQVAKMARAYRKKHGKFDEDFFDELQDWSNKNHMFQSGTPKPNLSPKAQKYLDEAEGGGN